MTRKKKPKMQTPLHTLAKRGSVSEIARARERQAEGELGERARDSVIRCISMREKTCELVSLAASCT